MGIFGDLFKATDWSKKELQSIFIVMTAMGIADGEIDEDEKRIITEMLVRLPGSESINWNQFATDALKIPTEECYSTLRDMRKNKREVAVAMLAGVAGIDGNVDNKEAEFFVKVADFLKIKLPS